MSERMRKALRDAAVALATAAIILRYRDAGIWTTFAMDARKAFAALGEEEDFFGIYGALDLVPRTDGPVNP